MKISYSPKETALTESWKIFSGDKEKTDERQKNGLDYYPFGSPLPGRQWSDGAFSQRRNGYQGEYSETDESGLLSFELRQYDPVIGRWISPDPYNQYHSPYVGMGNRPHFGVDPDGGVFDKIPVNGATRYLGPISNGLSKTGFLAMSAVNAGMRQMANNRNLTASCCGGSPPNFSWFIERLGRLVEYGTSGINFNWLPSMKSKPLNSFYFRNVAVVFGGEEGLPKTNLLTAAAGSLFLSGNYEIHDVSNNMQKVDVNLKAYTPSETLGDTRYTITVKLRVDDKIIDQYTIKADDDPDKLYTKVGTVSFTYPNNSGHVEIELESTYQILVPEGQILPIPSLFHNTIDLGGINKNSINSND